MTLPGGAPRVRLREVRDDDLLVFYAQQMDPVATRMAAFVPRDAGDPDAFVARWRGLIANPDVGKATIEWDGRIAGNIVAFTRDDKREIGYWVERNLWGKGIGGDALRLFLAIETTRPIYARIASDNMGSRRIAERAGFTAVGSVPIDGGAREEILYRLD